MRGRYDTHREARQNQSNGKTVGALVQPNYEVVLGIAPHADHVRNAVRELQPKLAVTNETVVVFE